MATDAEITAAIAASTDLAITPAQMVALIDRAIAAGLTEDGRIVVATGSRNTSISFGSIADAMRARAEYYALSIASTGFSSSPGEFVSG